MKSILLSILLLTSNSFGQDSADLKDIALNGVWQTAESGCGLRLSDDILSGLERLGGKSLEFMSILNLNGENYSRTNYDGTYCIDKDIGIYYEGETPIFCKKMATRSEGVFKIIGNGKLYFTGVPLNRSPLNTSEKLGTQFRDVSYRFSKSGVMIWEQHLETYCGVENPKYITYFIRLPMS